MSDKENAVIKNTVSNSALIEPLDLQRRLGKFAIRRKLILTKPDLVMRVLNNCIVVRCEHLWECDRLEYVAISPLFDVVPEGNIANEYQIVFTDYTKAVHFNRV